MYHYFSFKETEGKSHFYKSELKTKINNFGSAALILRTKGDANPPEGLTRPGYNHPLTLTAQHMSLSIIDPGYLDNLDT